MKNSYLKHGIACGAALLAFTCLPAYSWPGDSTHSVIRASQLMAQRRYAEALEAYQQAYEQEDQDKHLKGLALSNAGECCRKLQRFQEAKQYFKQAYPLLERGGHGVGNRDLNTLLVRFSLCFLAERNYARAEVLLKKCLENSLGVWTYDYRDLASAGAYTQMLVEVANAKDGSGARWYQYGEQELIQLVDMPGPVGAAAQASLAVLRGYQNGCTQTQIQQPRQVYIQPHYRDPYFNPVSTNRSRARYGLNGTQELFTNNQWRIR